MLEILCCVKLNAFCAAVKKPQYEFSLNTALLYLQPPTQNMGMSGGMNQSGAPPQPPHGHSMPSDGPPSGPHMQNQMNGQMPGKRAPFNNTDKNHDHFAISH